MVKISMDVFVKKYQPDRFDAWLAGRDVIPIDHSRPTPEAKEFLGDSFNDITSTSNSNFTESCGEDGERKRWEDPKITLCLSCYTVEFSTRMGDSWLLYASVVQFDSAGWLNQPSLVKKISYRTSDRF